MKEEMKMIIRRQQEYETVKQASLSEIWDIQEKHVFQDPVLKNEVLVKLGISYRKSQRKKTFRILGYILWGICATFLLWIIVLMLAGLLFGKEERSALEQDMEAYYESSPVRQAETAMDSGDYDKAEEILKEALEKYPKGYFLYITYAHLYVQTGRDDDAAKMLADVLINDFGVQNITNSQNQLYLALKEIPQDSLTDSLELYQNCLKTCDAYIEKYKSMNCLLEEENYYATLLICDELKAEGAYDYYLCGYYFKCYTGLKAYDQCAEYLKWLSRKQEETTDLRYPCDEEIRDYLEKIEDKVS